MGEFNFKRLLSYALVGGGATLVEWFLFWILSSKINLHYMITTVIAFLVAIFAKWLFERLVYFRNSHIKTITIIWEILMTYFRSIIGLSMNILFMWLFVDQVHLNEMFSKIIATLLIFIFYYLIRIFYIFLQKINKNK